MWDGSGACVEHIQQHRPPAERTLVVRQIWRERPELGLYCRLERLPLSALKHLRQLRLDLGVGYARGIHQARRKHPVELPPRKPIELLQVLLPQHIPHF